MTVELMVARKRWLLTLKLAPTGEAVNTMCRLLRTCAAHKADYGHCKH